MILHEYETTVIVHPETVDTEVARITERVDGVIQNFNGNVLFKDDWGVRKLAYLIAKQPRGRYLYFNYVSTAPCIAEVERIMRIESEVIRFMTVRLGENVDLEEIRLQERKAVRRPSDDTEAPRDDEGRDDDDRDIRPRSSRYGKDSDEGEEE